MSEEEVILVEGYVADQLPGGKFRVTIKKEDLERTLKENPLAGAVSLESAFKDSDEIDAVAHISGRIRKHRVRVLRGDRVTMEMSIYSIQRGRIIKRL